MHIPDGFLNGRTAATTAVLSTAALGAALRQARLHLPPRKVPLMGLSGAFVFAAMMLNFPVAGGTSGHIVGGVLCSVLLGPSAAVLVITSVLIVQCFVFADGGVLALGANVFNMAVVCSVGGYYVYRVARRWMPGARGRLAAVAFASWVATVLASVVCAGELAFSGVVAWSVAFPAMAGVHMLIGVGEAVVTTLVVYAIAQTRPDLLCDGPQLQTRGFEPVINGDAPPLNGDAQGSAAPRRYTEVLVFGSLIAVGLALFVSPFACPWPDGLDHVAETLGFKAHQAVRPVVGSPMPDYLFPGIKSVAVATSVAGLVGTVIAFGLALLLARLLTPTPTDDDVTAHPPSTP